MAGASSRRRLIGRILGAEPARSAHGGEALLKSREPAIHGAFLMEGAPRIILSPGSGSENGRCYCTKYEQRFHREVRALEIIARCYKPLRAALYSRSRFQCHARRNTPDRSKKPAARGVRRGGGSSETRSGANCDRMRLFSVYGRTLAHE
jgi:hypothetical protein